MPKTELFAENKDEMASIKRFYGNLWQRFLYGGTILTNAEFLVLEKLVFCLPENLKKIVVAQLEGYNFVQRENDHRALNFYRKKKGIPNYMDDFPVLKQKLLEAPLIRMKFSLSGDEQPYHAALHAVSGRIFCFTMDRPLSKSRNVDEIKVIDFEQSWLSNFE